MGAASSLFVRFLFAAGMALSGGLAAGRAAAAPSGACPFADAAPVGVPASIEDGDTLVLETGQAVRLRAILAPKGAGPAAAEARAGLARLVQGRRLMLAGDGEADRRGRIAAHVLMPGAEGTVWVQERLVEMGLARVGPFTDNRECIRALLAAEDAARGARRGLWRDPAFAVRAANRPDELNRLIDTFQIIEGQPVSIGTSRGRVYLNFGRRWKDDFTGLIDARGAAAFAAAGLTAESLEGRRLRLRGYIESLDGPLLRLTDPAQIELIGDDARNR